jgi:hypothetical protein
MAHYKPSTGANVTGAECNLLMNTKPPSLDLAVLSFVVELLNKFLRFLLFAVE